jgi:hypothetical protein
MLKPREREAAKLAAIRGVGKPTDYPIAPIERIAQGFEKSCEREGWRV